MFSYEDNEDRHQTCIVVLFKVKTSHVTSGFRICGTTYVVFLYGTREISSLAACSLVSLSTKMFFTVRDPRVFSRLPVFLFFFLSLRQPRGERIDLSVIVGRNAGWIDREEHKIVGNDITH